MENLHKLNIIVHVISGTLALLLGTAVLFLVKGDTRHRRYGRYFMRLVVVVIATGLMGVFIFHRNNFLLVITLLSGYNCYSGIRSVRLAGRKPELYDYFIPLIVMAFALYYLYHLKEMGLYWAASITYSTMAALFMVTIYDLARKFMAVARLRKAYMYEHVYKMVSALIALSSAFTGTVLPQYKPYSQLLPSVLGFAYIMITFIAMNCSKSVNSSVSR